MSLACIKIRFLMKLLVHQNSCQCTHARFNSSQLACAGVFTQSKQHIAKQQFQQIVNSVFVITFVKLQIRYIFQHLKIAEHATVTLHKALDLTLDGSTIYHRKKENGDPMIHVAKSDNLKNNPWISQKTCQNQRFRTCNDTTLVKKGTKIHKKFIKV